VSEAGNLTPSQLRLRDPLSEVTRKERKFLLGVSVVGIVIAQTGLVPSKITTLGIEFDKADQRALLIVFGWVVAYFLVAFIIYAASDLMAVGAAIRRSMHNWYLKDLAASDEERKRQFEALSRYYSPLWAATALRIMFFQRAIVEFVIPVAVGIYACFLPFTTPPPSPT
jgi:hypothetical protein